MIGRDSRTKSPTRCLLHRTKGGNDPDKASDYWCTYYMIQ